MRGDTIEDLRVMLEGRRVLRVEPRVYDDPDDPGRVFGGDYPVLVLDDGSEVVILDGNGAPPISEQEKLPWSEPLVWEGD